MGRSLLDYAGLKQRGIKLSLLQIKRNGKAGLFPKHILLGPQTSAWFEDEVDQWLEMKSKQREASDAA